MNSASVGWQCPECVKESAKSAPQISARRALQGATPIVTYVLIGINFAVFLVGLFTGDGVMGAGGGRIFQNFSLVPAAVHEGQWYRIITSGFLHFGIIHIALNMYVLFVVGRSLEPTIGRTRFVLAYLVALLGGSLGVVLTTQGSPYGGTVGASGAIFGTFGLLAVLDYSRGINPLSSGIGQTIFLNLIITFALPGISVGAHVGGLLIGAAAGGVLFLGKDIRRQSSNERMARASAVALIGLACFVIALAAAPALTLPG